MGQPAEPLRRATCSDLEAIPAHRVAEIVRGVLHTFPRPAPRHEEASSNLGAELYGPFRRGRGGPGGWRILDEPELHVPDPTEPDEARVRAEPFDAIELDLRVRWAK